MRSGGAMLTYTRHTRNGIHLRKTPIHLRKMRDYLKKQRANLDYSPCTDPYSYYAFDGRHFPTGFIEALGNFRPGRVFCRQKPSESITMFSVSQVSLAC